MDSILDRGDLDIGAELTISELNDDNAEVDRSQDDNHEHVDVVDEPLSLESIDYEEANTESNKPSFEQEIAELNENQQNMCHDPTIQHSRCKSMLEMAEKRKINFQNNNQSSQSSEIRLYVYEPNFAVLTPMEIAANRVKRILKQNETNHLVRKSGSGIAYQAKTGESCKPFQLKVLPSSTCIVCQREFAIKFCISCGTENCLFCTKEKAKVDILLAENWACVPCCVINNILQKESSDINDVLQKVNSAIQIKSPANQSNQNCIFHSTAVHFTDFICEKFSQYMSKLQSIEPCGPKNLRILIKAVEHVFGKHESYLTSAIVTFYSDHEYFIPDSYKNSKSFEVPKFDAAVTIMDGQFQPGVLLRNTEDDLKGCSVVVIANNISKYSVSNSMSHIAVDHASSSSEQKFHENQDFSHPSLKFFLHESENSCKYFHKEISHLKSVKVASHEENQSVALKALLLICEHLIFMNRISKSFTEHYKDCLAVE